MHVHILLHQECKYKLKSKVNITAIGIRIMYKETTDWYLRSGQKVSLAFNLGSTSSKCPEVTNDLRYNLGLNHFCFNKTLGLLSKN